MRKGRSEASHGMMVNVQNNKHSRPTHANALLGKKMPSTLSIYFAAPAVRSRLPVVVMGLFMTTRPLCSCAYIKAVWA